MINLSDKNYLVSSLTQLLEKTFDIDNDVTFIYNKYLKNIINDIAKKKLNNKIIDNIFSSKDTLIAKISSKYLKCDDCIKAHNINPIDIYIGLFNDIGSAYAHNFNKKDNKIFISLNVSVLRDLLYRDYVFYSYEKEIEKEYYKLLSAETLQAVIYHELSHWLSDSLYNWHITNKKALIYLDKKDIEIILKVPDVNISYFEIDAQVHSIKMLKKLIIKRLGDLKGNFIWNNKTMTNLADEYQTLHIIYDIVNKNYGSNISNIWIKNLKKRLDREKLLGKKMINTSIERGIIYY